MGDSILSTQRLIPGLLDRAPGKTGSSTTAPVANEPRFTDMIKDLFNATNELGNESAELQKAFLSGDPVELHRIMIKGEEAGLSMDLLLEIRNRLVSAYNELIRMPM